MVIIKVISRTKRPSHTKDGENYPKTRQNQTPNNPHPFKKGFRTKLECRRLLILVCIYRVITISLITLLNAYGLR